MPSVILTADRAVTGFVPVQNPAAGILTRVNGYAPGIRSRARRIALMRAMLTRAVELGAQYPADTLARAMADDDTADALAQRYTGTCADLTLTAYEDGATFGYVHAHGGGGNYPMTELVTL